VHIEIEPDKGATAMIDHHRFFNHIGACLKMIVYSAPLLFLSCAYGLHPSQLEQSAGDKSNQEVRVIPGDFETVWNAFGPALRQDYKIYLKDKSNGVIYTRWKTRIQKDRGSIRERKDLMHNVAIEDKAETVEKDAMTEFEIKNRMVIRILGNPDSTSTVSVTNIFKVTTHDMYEKSYDQDRYANKIFSASDFETKEQKNLLDTVERMIEQKRVTQ
jgi:hypothetical protein